MAPTLTLSKLTSEDFSAVIEVHACAFGSSALQRATFPPHLAHLTTPDELKAWRLRRWKKYDSNDHALAFKVVAKDETEPVGTLVGYAIWYRPGYDWDDADEKTMKELRHDQTDPDSTSTQITSNGPPACVDVGTMEASRTGITRMRRRVWADESNYWYLAGLGIHPECQRKGIATMLLKHGFDLADQDGLPIYLEATPPGMALYSYNGFHKVDELTLLDGTYTMTGMIRMPEGQIGPDEAIEILSKG